ncbi:hypothetical protein GGX14DRAFT_651791 [Mycena pura]|uniref:Uncharacterized protein n=1 Tax=Mycena pura TaxID=153505 RepID=A0AAD6V6L9_9AGAR|nr:hypothetical protein GGX14DRAFT_651791 [Mycena pura]
MSGTPTSPNPQKPPPLLLQGIAPHLFNSRTPRTTRRPIAMSSLNKDASDLSMRSTPALNCLDEAEGRVVRAERIIEELATIVTSYASNQRAAADAAVATAAFAVTNAESAAANAESALKRAQEFIKDWFELNETVANALLDECAANLAQLTICGGKHPNTYVLCCASLAVSSDGVRVTAMVRTTPTGEKAAALACMVEERRVRVVVVVGDLRTHSKCVGAIARR